MQAHRPGAVPLSHSTSRWTQAQDAKAYAAMSFLGPHLGTWVGPEKGCKSTLSSLLCFRDFEQHHQVLQCKFAAIVAGVVD
jgi:hypothetical protein